MLSEIFPFSLPDVPPPPPQAAVVASRLAASRTAAAVLLRPSPLDTGDLSSCLGWQCLWAGQAGLSTIDCP